MDKTLKVVLDKIEACKINESRHLDLSYLFLSKIPHEVFDLKKLTSLNLRGNYLSEIPEEFNELDNLWDLDLSNNYFEFSALRKIIRLEVIAHLNIKNNPFEKSIPIEIQRRSIRELIEYFDYLDVEDVTRLLESKVILVGNGEVGKTTIIRKLADPAYKVKVGKEPTTHGIKVSNWNINCFLRIPLTHGLDYEEFEEREVTNVRVNFWDFGGQEIYHATHQFFLTKRSLYIFVWEARKEEDYSQFEYWLNIIKFLSDSSPVLIVMNKFDVRDKNIDEYSLKEKFPNIHSFIKISCVRNIGLKELRAKIEQCVATLPHLLDVLPKTWKRIRAALESITQEYISLDYYYSLCRSYHLEQKQADFLSEYFHDLGVILHFPKDGILRKTVILKPEWATKAVYALIDDRKIQSNGGRFSYEDLDRIWEKKKYPHSIHSDLIRLMEKFELVFNLIGTVHYIIPELLEAKRPALDYEKFLDNLMRVEYSYVFMPAGILSRLLCRLHHLVLSGQYWKDGMVLQYEDSTALILSERINKKLIVKIVGPNASQLLSIIRHELSLIHNSLNLIRDSDFFEMIPCNCIECERSANPEFFSYSTLRKFLLKGKKTISCNKSTEDVGIDSLVNGYELKTRENDLVYHILNACSKLQGHPLIVDGKEDSRNSFIASVIDSKFFIAKDQSRWGRSAKGKNEGELDIRIDGNNNIPLSIFEGFILNSLDTRVIDEHFSKLSNYDPLGLKENYVVIYSEAKDFNSLWSKYLNYIMSYKFKYELTQKPKDISEQLAYGAEIRVARTVHNRNDERVKVYHLFLNMKT